MKLGIILWLIALFLEMVVLKIENMTHFEETIAYHHPYMFSEKRWKEKKMKKQAKRFYSTQALFRHQRDEEEKKLREKMYDEVYPYNNPDNVRDPILQCAKCEAALFHIYSLYDMDYENNQTYLLLDNSTPYAKLSSVPKNVTDPPAEVSWFACDTKIGTATFRKHKFGYHSFKIQEDLLNVNATYKSKDVERYFIDWVAPVRESNHSLTFNTTINRLQKGQEEREKESKEKEEMRKNAADAQNLGSPSKDNPDLKPEINPTAFDTESDLDESISGIDPDSVKLTGASQPKRSHKASRGSQKVKGTFTKISPNVKSTELPRTGNR